MNRSALVLIVIAAVLGAGAYARHKFVQARRTPEMKAPIIEVMRSPQSVPDEIYAPQICFGDETNLIPEFEMAIHVSGDSARINCEISILETIGLEVCSIHLRVKHRTQNPQTGEWAPDGLSAPVFIPRLIPGEVFETVTPILSLEFPTVTEPGPPQAWSVVVETWSEAAVLFALDPSYASVGASWPQGPAQHDESEHQAVDHEHAESVRLHVPHEPGDDDQRDDE